METSPESGICGGRTDSHDGVDCLASARVVLAHGQQARARLVDRRVREAVPLCARQLLWLAHLRAQRLPVQLLVLRPARQPIPEIAL